MQKGCLRTVKIIDSAAGRPERVRRGVAMGFFDGMHRGHQQVVRTLAYLSAERGLRSCVYTFDVHPSKVISGRENPEGYLCAPEERLQLIAQSGAEEIYLQRFDRQLADMEEDEFLSRILVDALDARLVVIGYDFRYGKNRSGNADSMRAWAEGHGIEVVVADAYTMAGNVVSSTLIRRLVAQGRMEEASACLGRDYTLGGTVTPGRRLGSRLGFPTANITVTPGKVAPVSGVYATRTRMDGRVFESITNIGTRPTVDSQDTRLVVETFLLDTKGDYYGKRIDVEFLSRIREEKQFGSLIQLSSQIGEDIASVRRWHDTCERFREAATVNGVPIWILRTARFRTSILGFTFRTALHPRAATVYNLLLRVLVSCCRRLPDRQAVSVELDRLYGARIDATVDKEGDILCLHFVADAVSTWTDGTRVFDEAARLLSDMLADPLVDGEGLFPVSVVETERASYGNELQARWNDREKYAVDQGVGWYLDGTRHGTDTDGDPEILREITVAELAQAYRDMLETASLTVVAGGDIGIRECDWLTRFVARLPAGRRAPVPVPGVAPSPCAIPDGCRRKTDHRPMEQARIVACLTGLPPYFSAEGMAVNVLNSMFGADTHSLLFEHVRERKGLAYSVFTSVMRHVRGLAVYAGVAPVHVEAALDTIGEQLETLALGRFDRSLFDRSVTMVRNQLLTVSDSLAGMLGFYSAGLTNGRLFHLEDALRLLDDVSPGRIQALAAGLRMASIYVLMPDSSGGREDL